MSNYIEPIEDELPTRDFGPWVIEKLDYLKRYIEIFETSMHSKPWRERHYIDLFAGTGKCRVAEMRNIFLGSSLLALTTTYPFTHYFFADKEPENVTVLRKRCDASPISQLVECKTGDGNVIVNEIVEHIQKVDQKYIKGAWSSLNLAFLDPDGLELHWDTVATLTKPSRMDLIIHYSQMGLNRNMGQYFEAEEDTFVDLFFGDREWRKIFQKYRNKEEQFIHRRLMDHYKEKLQSLGYKEVFRRRFRRSREQNRSRNLKITRFLG